MAVPAFTLFKTNLLLYHMNAAFVRNKFGISLLLPPPPPSPATTVTITTTTTTYNHRRPNLTPPDAPRT